MPDPVTVLRIAVAGVTIVVEVKGAAASLEAPTLPAWDGRALRWRGVPVHAFRQPAERQTALLDAFEAAGWAQRVVVPEDLRDPKVLSDTVNALNKSLPPGTLRVYADAGDACWGPS